MNLIVGKHNGTNQVFYWENRDYLEYKIGDYAIVENKSDYDMVKIVGDFITNEKYQYHITKTKELKKIIKIIPRNEIRKD